ncbi:MAG: galactose mutarotase [Pirellulales bacterium]|nr:galactose mutarotase [Pirellulales bacterium]
MDNLKLEKDVFGTTAAGETVDRYTLRNSRGITARIITYGATVTELFSPDRQGRPADIVLGFDELASYEAHNAYFGCMVGRVAFRIRGGQFLLDGKNHQLAVDGENVHLHGGPRGFNRMVWRAEPISNAAGPAVKFSHRSPDGDQGYPGTLEASVVYSLTEENELRIECTATTDRPTLVNLTHHGYFNLSGAGRGDILSHELQLDADRYIPASAPDVPTGEIAPVRGTPFDFTRSMAIGARIEETGGDPRGYDVCFLRNSPEGAMARVAAAFDPASGRTMEVSTTEPALVFYTANYLDGTPRGKGGAIYRRHAALCLDTGRPPDAIRYPNFPSIVLRPGETYRHVCSYRFSAG